LEQHISDQHRKLKTDHHFGSVRSALILHFQHLIMLDKQPHTTGERKTPSNGVN